nr:histone-like nucleoid-structuring protein Lsr2 [Streptomyces sp. NBC_00690]
MEGASSGNARETAANHVRDRRPEDEAIRVWAQTNGCLVNNHGRIPASIREAYEASR